MDIQIEYIGPTGFIKSTEPNGQSESTGPIVQNESTEPNGPIGTTGPIVQNESTGPTGPTVQNESTEPEESKEPVEQYKTKETPIISGNFDTLVLSGGSIHAFIMLGSLQYAIDNNLLHKITTYVGASAGAICCYLLAIGYSPTEIMVYFCTYQVLENLKHFNLVDMMNGGGATSFIYIHEQLERMTIEKIGRLITLNDLYTM